VSSMGERRRGDGTEREPDYGGRRFITSEPIQESGEGGQRCAHVGGFARVVQVADALSEGIERGQRVAVLSRPRTRRAPSTAVTTIRPLREGGGRHLDRLRLAQRSRFFSPRCRGTARTRPRWPPACSAPAARRKPVVPRSGGPGRNPAPPTPVPDPRHTTQPTLINRLVRF
jgi:hypothetical protein